MKPYLQDADLTVWHGDCNDVLWNLRGQSLDAIVTSPPYADARPDVPAPSPEEFPQWLAPRLRAMAYALKPDGSLMLNLGRRFRDGEESDYIEMTLLVARELGWKRIDTLIWFKPNANARGGPYLHDKHEIVFWLAQQTDVYRGYDADTRAPYDEGTAARYARGYQQAAKFHPRDLRSRQLNPDGARPASVVVVYTGGEHGNPHPSPMPQPLAEYLVALSCPRGGTVCDPFAGSGTTGRAARVLGRRAILIESDESYCRLIAERTQQQSLLAQEAAT